VDLDFKMNRTLWNDLGHEVALPVRMRNLRDYFQAVSSENLTSWLYGKSLRTAWVKGELFQDHDDDVKLALPETNNLRGEGVFGLLETLGFEIIRESREMISIVRYERYIDIHLTGKKESTSPLRVHGEMLPVSETSDAILRRKYGEHYRVLDPVSPGIAAGAKRAPMRLPFSIPRTRFSRVLAPQRYEEKSLTESDFLSLKIDSDDAINWSWRGNHLKPLFVQGEILRKTVERLRELGLSNLLRSVREVDTARAFLEPVNMSRRFWHEGNNFFLYPLIFGFRHQVMPYKAANVYIALGMEPLLYSREYFEGLPVMSDSEIGDFSSKHPIEVDGNSVVSGRHRVAAMVGRLARGQSYVPMRARIRV
jgi:hypothetical protein